VTEKKPVRTAADEDSQRQGGVRFLELAPLFSTSTDGWWKISLKSGEFAGVKDFCLQMARLWLG
jgi:hypothetical protein